MSRVGSKRSGRLDWDSDDEGDRGRKSWRDLQRQQRNSGRVFTVDANPSSMASLATPSRPSAARPAASNDSSKPIFDGLLAATVTAMHPNGKPNLDLINDYAAALKADGVSGVFLNGTTGESMSLTVNERKAITERWMATGIKVCAHIGALSVEDICDLASHAQSIGVHAVAVMCPMFFKPNTVDDVVAVLAQVSAAAPQIPLLVYHFPVLTGIPFRLHDIMKRAIERGTVPNLRGAKFTNLDFGDYAACRALGGNITDMIYSQEQNMFGAAFLGCTAFVGMQFSMVGPLYNRIVAAASKGDKAETWKLQKLTARFINMVSSIVGPTLEKTVAAAKVLVSLRLEADMGPMRAPGATLTVHECQRLKEGMTEFVKEYTAAVKPSESSAPKAINVHAMPGYNGQLNDKILRRIDVMAREIGFRNLRDRFPHLEMRNGEWRGRMPSANVNASQYIDHTVLKPEVTKAEITKLCKEARENNFFAVCVNGCRVEQCVDELRGTSVKVAAVIGFPLGAGTSRAKAREARELVQMGASEIDMVMNVGAMKDGDFALVYDDIKAVVDAAAPAVVKVIFETCLLNEQEITDASILSVAAGAGFVKTSTGFNKGGATPEAIDIMLAVVGNEALVKASGGVRDAVAAGAYISAGVKRIGTSSGVAIVSGKQAGAGY